MTRPRNAFAVRGSLRRLPVNEFARSRHALLTRSPLDGQTLLPATLLGLTDWRSGLSGRAGVGVLLCRQNDNRIVWALASTTPLRICHAASWESAVINLNLNLLRSTAANMSLP